MEEIVYLNGVLIPRSLAILSPFDHGFLYGYGLFETMRADNGVIFRIDHHLARLRNAAETLGIHSQLASVNLETACYDTLTLNKFTDARLRLTVSAGEGDITPNPATCKEITVFIAARPLTPLSPESYEKGFKAAVSSLRRNSQSPLSRLKTSCYLENVLARQEAKAKGADEAIVLNEVGLVAEGGSSNIFCISNGELLTPSTGCGALPGITREAVLELAPALGIRVKETDLTPEALMQAQEAFFTNAIIEIMPLTYIDDRPIGTGKSGAVTLSISRAYRKLVAGSQTKRMSC
jgi:branched-chain amino acid aminotransferase group I